MFHVQENHETHRRNPAPLLFALSGAEAKPLKVFILAGQSNMEGPVNISTIDSIGDDPATAPLFKMMRGADGKPATCEGSGNSKPTSSLRPNSPYGNMVRPMPATTISAARRPSL